METPNTRDLRNEASEIDSVINIYGGPTEITSTHPEACKQTTIDIGNTEAGTTTAETTQSVYSTNITNNEILNKTDSLDANEPETFTLEDFRKIILDFRNNNKDCILARISSPENERHHSNFNNYYIASEVNKLLFKYERDRRLLHRMKVRDPLNNQYISGPVHYYRITCFEIDRSIAQYFFNAKDEESKNNCKTVTKFINNNKTNTRMNNQLRPDIIIPLNINDKKIVITEKSIKPEKINETINKYSCLLIDEVKKGNIKVPEKENTNNNFTKINYTATYFANDDDFLTKSEVREYFRVNSMDPSQEFLFELDRTNNDLFALLDNDSETADESVMNWKRILTVHLSVLLSLLGTVILLSGFPFIFIIAFPLVILTLISFLVSLLYIMVFRRDTFGSLAVQSIEDDV